MMPSALVIVHAAWNTVQASAAFPGSVVSPHSASAFVSSAVVVAASLLQLLPGPGDGILEFAGGCRRLVLPEPDDPGYQRKARPVGRVVVVAGVADGLPGGGQVPGRQLDLGQDVTGPALCLRAADGVGDDDGLPAIPGALVPRP